MISNLVSQLKEAGALDRIDEVYEEIPRVRKDLGMPPLVTPTSQIVGIQAVQNVLFGRYKVVTGQVKDYMYGLYGCPPLAVDEKIRKMVLKGYERGEVPITQRPGDILEPEMEAAELATKDIAQDIGDVLIYALYPTTGMRFLRWKYGLEEPPPETKAKTLEDIVQEDERIAKAKAGELVEKSTCTPTIHDGSGSFRKFNVYLDGEVYNVAVEPLGVEDSVVGPTDKLKVASNKSTQAERKDEGVGSPVEEKGSRETISAPMPGIIIRYEVGIGDEVKSGDTVVVLEAMKMAIDLPATVDGKVVAINYKEGDRVDRDDALLIIG
jgi:pyruvate carboxylase